MRRGFWGKNMRAEVSWHKALHAASAHQLTRLAGLAEVTAKWGWGDQRLEVLSQVMDEFPNEKWAQETYAAGVYYREGKTKDLGGVLREALHEESRRHAVEEQHRQSVPAAKLRSGQQPPSGQGGV